MAEMTDYAPGTPCWVDVSSPDMEAATAFYSGVFGWDAHVSPDPQAGGYTMFTPAGTPAEEASRHAVAAAMPIMNEGQPPAWTTYVSVADADATAKLVEEAGGRLLMPPMDVLDQGRLAILVDDQGAVVGIWQPRAFNGAGLVNEPGSFSWNELACRDVEAAKRFYGHVFGWGGNTQQMGPMTYTEWKLGDKSIGGMARMDESWPAEVVAHWMVYFSVDDCDVAAARVAELGGTVSIPPLDIPPGRFSVVSDPHGAVFSVIKLAPQPAGM